MLRAYAEWLPKLILPHLYQKAAGWAEQQQPVAVRDPHRALKRGKTLLPAQPSYPGHPCPAHSPRDTMLTPKMPNPARHPLTPTHPLASFALGKTRQVLPHPRAPFAPTSPQQVVGCTTRRVWPSCSRSHGKLHLSGKTQGQITAAHTRWGDTMHS